MAPPLWRQLGGALGPAAARPAGTVGAPYPPPDSDAARWNEIAGTCLPSAAWEEFKRAPDWGEFNRQNDLQYFRGTCIAATAREIGLYFAEGPRDTRDRVRELVGARDAVCAALRAEQMLEGIVQAGAAVDRELVLLYYCSRTLCGLNLVLPQSLLGSLFMLVLPEQWDFERDLVCYLGCAAVARNRGPFSAVDAGRWSKIMPHLLEFAGSLPALLRMVGGQSIAILERPACRDVWHAPTLRVAVLAAQRAGLRLPVELWQKVFSFAPQVSVAVFNNLPAKRGSAAAQKWAAPLFN